MGKKGKKQNILARIKKSVIMDMRENHLGYKEAMRKYFPHLEQKPMETLFALSDKENVLYLNTFSRTIYPAVRIGYMVLPNQLVQPFQNRLGFYSCTVSAFEQYVLAELISSGVFERHINRVRRNIRKANKPGI